MKAQDFVNKLQSLIVKHGNLDIVVPEIDGPFAIEDVQLDKGAFYICIDTLIGPPQDGYLTSIPDDGDTGNDFTRHRDGCSDCKGSEKPADLCPIGAEFLRVRAAAVREAIDAQLSDNENPNPQQLWKEANGDQEKYRALMIEHGWMVEAKPEGDKLMDALITMILWRNRILFFGLGVGLGWWIWG